MNPPPLQCSAAVPLLTSFARRGFPFPPRYVTVNPNTYKVTGEFDSLDHWYRNTLRKEFAERYGLRGASS